MSEVIPYISSGEINIFAKKLTKTTKLFTTWDNDTYMLGLKGDYIATSVNAVGLSFFL